ncbi:P-loop containing nucleoside triphosphate hydrolase protein [Macrolepiota fuliginosa MF-IS2]|uniref:P-loop containing nucleoside triphosphate hydrolase protein n=1 Tax=Macrolepiota fuliginosa MF-IS2 TaxID=1400762 RepID=A0A9P5XDB8_9AGAR|nr:P-loop containing nucleoside triphosphate hydrolase protein [Macrolepiota fuliginosa MF-IS2]
MDTIAADLAATLITHVNGIPPHKRLLIGIAGVPASGKSTFSLSLAAKLTESLTGAQHAAILVGLDGWHYSRKELDAMPDPKLAYDRRGAHWTFDGASYVSFIRSLREDITPRTPVITAPSFDHAVKDPTPGAVAIHPYHRIVIVEGLYTFLSIDPWVEAGKLLDERWFIHIDVLKAQDRLVKRHVITGVAKDMDEAMWRAQENDGPNGTFIIENMLEPTKVITSIDDPSLTLL